MVWFRLVWCCLALIRLWQYKLGWYGFALNGFALG